MSIINIGLHGLREGWVAVAEAIARQSDKFVWLQNFQNSKSDSALFNFLSSPLI